MHDNLIGNSKPSCAGTATLSMMADLHCSSDVAFKFADEANSILCDGIIALIDEGKSLGGCLEQSLSEWNGDGGPF